MTKQFLARLQKLDTGKLNVFSTAVVTQTQAEKLAYIFMFHSGQKKDFWVHFDEFSKERLLLSRIEYSTQPLSDTQLQTLNRLNLIQTGVFTPLDLIEEFEARNGRICRDRDGDFFLEGERDSLDEDLL